MGSFLKPKAVPLPQTNAQPQKNITPNVVPTGTTQTDAEIQAGAREQSLLRRNRGRFGTIATGFSGFLNPSQADTSRKTLLGE